MSLNGGSRVTRAAEQKREFVVLESFPAGSPRTNPYLLQLVRAIERADQGASVRYFSWTRALFGRYDVLHVHWPERFLRGESPLGTAAKRMRFVGLLARIALLRTPVVRTIHNLGTHERGDRLETLLLALLDRRTALRIRLNPFTPVDPSSPTRTILHGHYRDWCQAAPRAERRSGRILFFGLLRPYKGIEELVASFGEVGDQGATMRVVGGGGAPGLVDNLLLAASRDPRVSVRPEYLSDEELALEISAAQLVVLPYREVHNSGAALLALSLDRPLLMPEGETTGWLQAEVGGEWLLTYRPPLTAAVIEDALARSRSLPRARPDLSGREWGPIGAAHAEAFRSVIGPAAGLQGAQRRYST